MAIGTEKQAWTIALVGNPNTGKSTLFGALSGVAQQVGNYPGVTVEKKLGELVHEGRAWILVDLPGTYSLAPRSLDELVTVDVLLGRRADVETPDVIVCVVSAANLARNLYLVSQVLEMGRPVVVALTMVDLAESSGLTIDADRLSSQLGVPVVPIHARKKVGLGELKAAVDRAAELGPPSSAAMSPFPEPFRAEVDRLEAAIRDRFATLDDANPLPRYLVERMLIDHDSLIADHLEDGVDDRKGLRDHLEQARRALTDAGCAVPGVETTARYGWVARVTEGVSAQDEVGESVSIADRLDSVLTHRLWGPIILAFVLLMTFNAVFAWASVPMDWIDAGFAAAGEAIEGAMAEGPLRSLLVDGIIGGIGAVVIFLPQILILFGILTALEECGYLSRAAYLMDRIMVRAGLSGKSFIPLLSSFACAIPGVMATRVIENRRDRLTTILIAPLMSCSARLPVYNLMVAAFIPRRSYLGGWLQLQGLTLLAMYLVGVVAAFLVAFVVKRFSPRRSAPGFLMEMPAYQWPSPITVGRRMVDRGWDFLRNAGTIIFAVSIVMWGLLYYPRLSPDEIGPLLAGQEQASRALETAEATGDDGKIADAQSNLRTIDDRIAGAQQRQSLLGRAGRLIEPVVRPLGWDWRIGSAALASFPAREVVVATLGVIFDVGEDVADGEGNQRLSRALRSATWSGSDRPLFTIPVALSIMVFFALCAQCVSTLAVIWRETGTWTWPALSFGYMTALAYLAAFATYQLGTWASTWF